jgi:hypothetical protein
MAASHQDDSARVSVLPDKASGFLNRWPIEEAFDLEVAGDATNLSTFEGGDLEIELVIASRTWESP